MPGHSIISSTFHDPKHPFVPGHHDGIDIPAPVGTPILAASKGIVGHVSTMTKKSASWIDVHVDDSFTFSVAHMSRIDVKPGDNVKAGQILGLSGGEIGALGSGPWTTGPHLHFTLYENGIAIDPLLFLCRDDED